MSTLDIPREVLSGDMPDVIVNSGLGNSVLYVTTVDVDVVVEVLLGKDLSIGVLQLVSLLTASPVSMTASRDLTAVVGLVEHCGSCLRLNLSSSAICYAYYPSCRGACPAHIFTCVSLASSSVGLRVDIISPSSLYSIISFNML